MKKHIPFWCSAGLMAMVFVPWPTPELQFQKHVEVLLSAIVTAIWGILFAVWERKP